MYKTLGSTFTPSTVRGTGGGGRGKGRQKESPGKLTRRKRTGVGIQAGYTEHWDRTRATWDIQ